MSVHTLQVTLSGTGANRLSATRTPCRQLIIQNNATHSMRVGDVNVSSTQGCLLASGTPGGAVNTGPFAAFDTDISDWYVAGTNGDVVDVIYVQ